MKKKNAKKQLQIFLKQGPRIPCHKMQGDFFSCLFCYCPLYALGRSCGGNFNYLKDGTKCCDACIVPHTNGGYEYVLGKYGEIKKIAERG